MPSLGKLKKLGMEEIKILWPNEEKDLSPWIADNINDLNKALNLQIEIEAREEYIYNFKLDLAGTDTYSQIPVIIENQFGASDHDHLGKLITYAAAKEAGIVIWIANEIQDAHKNAVEWLNKISPQEMTFYGVELEVFTIDGSSPAPNFRIVAGPPPSKRKPIVSEISPRNKQYREFFERLRTKINHIQPNLTRAKVSPQSWWHSANLGRSGFSVNSCFTIDNNFKVEIYIDLGKKEYNEIAFHALKETRVAIEEKIGKELVWDPLPDSRACRTYVAIDGTIDDDEQKLTELVEWAAPLVIKFREVFSPLVKNIQIED